MLTSEILNMIGLYLNRAITLEELEDWLVPRLPLFFKWPYSSLAEFTAEIEVALADMSEQRQTEDEFRSLLNRMLRDVEIVWVNYPAGDVTTYTGSSNQPSPTVPYAIPELVGNPS